MFQFWARYWGRQGQNKQLLREKAPSTKVIEWEKVFILDIANFHLLYQEIANIIQSRKGRHFSNPNWLVSVSVGVRAILLHFLRLQTVQFLQPAFLGLQNPWQNIWPTPWHCKENGSLEAVLFGWANSHFDDFLLKGKLGQLWWMSN